MDRKSIESAVKDQDVPRMLAFVQEIDDALSSPTRDLRDDIGDVLDARGLLVEKVRLVTAVNDEIDLVDVADLLTREAPVRSEVIKNIQAVGVLAHRGRLQRNGDRWNLATRTLGQVKRLCHGQAFFDYPVTHPATAFLVGEDLVVTLRHNVSFFPSLEDIRVIFNFELKSPGRPATCKLDFAPEEIFAVTDRYSLVDDSPDALIVLRLSRKVKDRTPVTCNFGTPIAAEGKVYMIGHPCGLPKIHADNAKVLDGSSPEAFTASLDAFAGNSGSPVFNAETDEVEGALARGGEDYETIGDGNGGHCRRVIIHQTPNLFPYKIVRIQKLKSLLGPQRRVSL
jgi:hypothetical protein